MWDFLKWLKVAMETYSSSKTLFEGTLCVVDKYEKNWKICIMRNVQSFIKIGIATDHHKESVTSDRSDMHK